MLIDLHVHTTRGSGDSSLAPPELIEAAAQAGLDGVCITEHSLLWDAHDLADAAGSSGIRLYAGLEVETDAGHVLVIGGNGYAAGMHRLDALAEHAVRQGAALVFAHPFRHHTASVPGQECLLTARHGAQIRTSREAAAIPALAAVHALEAVNGATGESDNDFAREVARELNLPATGGSDAHSLHGVGSGVTEVAGEPRDSAELAEAIRSGAVAASYRRAAAP
jgi:predicted metal-dependent phosphoesterase TrpH